MILALVFNMVPRGIVGSDTPHSSEVMEKLKKVTTGKAAKTAKGKTSQPQCGCGNGASPHDGFCRHCRPKSQKLRASKKQCRLLGSYTPDTRIAAKTKREVAAWRKSMYKPYSKRSEILKKIGFNSYSEYLESKLWKSIRVRVFLEKGKRCQFCSKRANQVHHSKYTTDNLSGASLKYLHPICRNCHENAEVDKDGFKRPLDECNKILGINTGTLQGQT